MDLSLFARDAERLGRRPAVILLPAYPYDHRIWEAVSRRLVGIPILAFDPPGFGNSPILKGMPSLEAYAQTVSSQARRLGVSRALVVGNSWGGYTAMALAEKDPKLLSGIALIGTRADSDTPQVRAKRAEIAVSALVGEAEEIVVADVENQVGATTVKEHPEVVELLQKWAGQSNAEGISWAQRAMAPRRDRLDVLKELAIPALVMRGQEDTLTTDAQAQQMAKALATSVVTVPNAGHLVPAEAPGVLARSLQGLYALC